MRGKPDTAAAVAAVALHQHGVVARSQLRSAGLSRATIDRLVGSGRLLALHRGVYAVGHRAIGRHGRALAAVLACGPGAVLSHRDAAVLWSLLRPRRGSVHVIARSGKRRDGIVVHRTRSLPRSDVTRHHGIPVTTPARTLLDLSGCVPLGLLEAALAEAQVQKLVRPADLARRATGDLGRLLPAAAPTRSRLERDFRALLREHDLAQPVSNGIVEGYEVDVHWPDLRLVAELDGYEFHAHRRAFEDDRLRDQVLMAAGWRTVRVTHRQMTERRAATAGRFRRLLRATAGATTPPGRALARP